LSAKRKTHASVIRLSNVEAFREYIITWFADVATTYLINRRLSRDVGEKRVLALLCTEADNYVKRLIEERGRDKVCGLSPLPITGNDKKEYFDICKASEMICDASRSNVELISLQPALSLEFAEHVRIFNPQITNKYLKREVVMVESIIHGLAILGTYISHTYTVTKKDETEWGYTYVEVPNPEIIDHKKLSGMIQKIIKAVTINEGSRLSILIGIASTMTLIYGRNLIESLKRSPLNVNFLRLSKHKGGNKALVKAFEVLSLSSLATDVYHLGIASPLYNMISRYPPGEKSSVRTFIEELSKAIATYNSLRNTEEIYKVLRNLTSENLRNDLRKHYTDTWDEILSGLLQIRI